MRTGGGNFVTFLQLQLRIRTAKRLYYIDVSSLRTVRLLLLLLVLVLVLVFLITLYVLLLYSGHKNGYGILSIP